MDVLSFVVEMTKALAWPALVASIIWLWPKNLSHLLTRLLRLRFGGFEAEFADKSAEVAESVARQINTPEQANKSSETVLETYSSRELAELADQSPRAAIIEAWIRLENRLREIAQKNGVHVPAYRSSVGSITTALLEAEVIDSKTVQSIEGLKALRNLAVHASDANLTPQKAKEFVVLAGAIMVLLMLPKPPGE